MSSVVNITMLKYASKYKQQKIRKNHTLKIGKGEEKRGTEKNKLKFCIDRKTLVTPVEELKR